MEPAIKLALYVSLFYVFIFVVTLAYHSLIYKPTNVVGAQVIAKQTDVNQQGQSLTYLIVELIIITIIGGLEVKFKFIRRLIFWIKLHKGVIGTFMFFLFAIALFIFPIWISTLFGVPLGTIVGSGLDIVFILISIFYIYSISFFILIFFSVPIAFLLFLSPLNLLYSFVIWLGMVILGTVIFVVYKNKNTMNLITVVIATSSAMFFGILFTPLIMVILLVILAVYDYIAVFKSKHMQLIAGAFAPVMPILFMVGDKDYLAGRIDKLKNLNKTGKQTYLKERKGAILGSGDVIIPGAVISSFIFARLPVYAFAAMIGSIIGISLNMLLLKTGKFNEGLPALPLLTFGIFLGIGTVLALSVPI